MNYCIYYNKTFQSYGGAINLFFLQFMRRPPWNITKNEKRLHTGHRCSKRSQHSSSIISHRCTKGSQDSSSIISKQRVCWKTILKTISCATDPGYWKLRHANNKKLQKCQYPGYCKNCVMQKIKKLKKCQ